MKLAILSDIHGNLEALEEVLLDMKDIGVDEAVCLGDAVGYGADPAAVLSRLWREGIPCIMGNHEDAVNNDRLLEWFNPQAKDAILKTRAMLSPEAREKIARWPQAFSKGGALFVHGFPPDSVHTYLFEVPAFRITEAFDAMEEKIVFVGHTHTLQLVEYDGQNVIFKPLEEGTRQLGEFRYIVNAGSVGQPRDGNNKAKYVIWDSEKKTLTVRFIPYDIATASTKILEAGMPEFCAHRLWQG